jgi:hypothetical protein
MQNTEQPEPAHLDVAGQPNGPHPDIQAQVDAEQLVLIERIKAERAPAEAEEQEKRRLKHEKALADQNARRELDSTVRALLERVKLLEAKAR